ncbi:MAG: YbaK/EbsC family protein [Candidatus Micrarchaeia archaeon]|jgi:prolyl-tRNA editing enzyme YbaK/EbsC (Cys-tRNA(Pro) deacylase)
MNTNDVEDFVRVNGLEAEFKILEPESTRTSELAARAVGCSIAEIAKSIAFYYTKKGAKYATVVVLSGDRRVDEDKLAEFLEADDVKRMSPEEVRKEIGYTIGGVPPFPHKENVKILADKSLFRFRRVWSAAGAPNAVMKISPAMLVSILHIELCDVSVSL